MLKVFAGLVLFTGYFVSLFKLAGLPPSLPLIFLGPFLALPFVGKNMSGRELGFIFIIIIFLVQFLMNDNALFWEGLKQSCFCFICFYILRNCSDATVLKAVKPIVIMCLILAVTGLFQAIRIEPFASFSPLPSSNFIGSGGFGSISLIRPNFALGNSINTGSFFVLSIFLLLYGWVEFRGPYPFVILFVFLLAIVLTISRSAFMGVLLILPLVIERTGKRTAVFLIGVLVAISYKWIAFIFMRFFDSSSRIGSDNERLEIFLNFRNAFEYQTMLVGNTNLSDAFKITDGIIFYNILSIGLLSTLIYVVLIIAPSNLKKGNGYRYFTLLVIFCFFSIINNSFHAFYNLFLLIFTLRLMSCTFPIRSYSPFSMEKNI